MSSAVMPAPVWRSATAAISSSAPSLRSKCRAKDSVAYVWLCAVASYAGGICKVYPYVVEHCGGLYGVI